MKFHTLAASLIASTFLVDGTFASSPNRQLRLGGGGGGKFGPLSCDELPGKIEDAEEILDALDFVDSEFADKIAVKMDMMIKRATARQAECDGEEVIRPEFDRPPRGERPQKDCDNLQFDLVDMQDVQDVLNSLSNNDIAPKMATMIGFKIDRLKEVCDL